MKIILSWAPCQNQKSMEVILRFIVLFQRLFLILRRNSSSNREVMSKKLGPSRGQIVVVVIHDWMNQISMPQREESRMNSV